MKTTLLIALALALALGSLLLSLATIIDAWSNKKQHNIKGIDTSMWEEGTVLTTGDHGELIVMDASKHIDHSKSVGIVTENKHSHATIKIIKLDCSTKHPTDTFKAGYVRIRYSPIQKYEQDVPFINDSVQSDASFLVEDSEFIINDTMNIIKARTVDISVYKDTCKYVWESGFNFTEVKLDKRGFYAYDIDTGYYYEFTRETAYAAQFHHEIELHDVPLAHYYIYCYIENGQMKSTGYFLTHHNKVAMLYVIDLKAMNGRIEDVEINDCRGFSLKECSKITKY